MSARRALALRRKGKVNHSRLLTVEESQALMLDAIPEGSFQAQLVAEAVRWGWKVHYTTISLRSPTGWLDLFMVRGTRMVAAELKSMRGKLSEKQRGWLVAWAATGKVEAYVWNPTCWQQIYGVLG